MIPYCQDMGVGLIPWSPLARGAFTRPRGSRDALRENTDNRLKNTIRGRETEADRAIVNRVEEIAKRKGASMAQVATSWSLAKGMNPIIGLNKKERIDEACEAIKIELTEEEIKYLEEPYIPNPL